MKSPDPVSPKSVGPYRIVESLGRGGMGIVYRAVHGSTGDVAAVKTVRVPNPKQLESIRREIRALKRLDHPCVVRILDEGLENAMPWYAMEFLQGVTLRRFCADFIWAGTDISTAWSRDVGHPGFWEESSPGTPSPYWNELLGPTVDDEGISAAQTASAESELRGDPALDLPRISAAGGRLTQVLTLTGCLSRTLAYLHGRGIVHGDLKPENILVNPDATPKILDFGLVTHSLVSESRERLDMSHVRGGTLIYLAPELITGELVDARADLYSLGCILYELITGIVPFAGSTASQLMKSKLEQTPLPPSRFATGVPEALEVLILALLRKHPGNRVGYAEDVTRILLELGADEGVISALPTPDQYLYRPRFMGRRRELKEVDGLLENLHSGRGAKVLISGESGIGKTRLLLKTIQMAAYRKIMVLSGESIQVAASGAAHDAELSPPLSAFRRPFRGILDHCWDQDRAVVDRIIGVRGHVLAAYEPDFLALPGQDRYPPAQDLPPNPARLRLYTYLGEVLAAIAASTPVLLILDDLQWADELTLGFLEFSFRSGFFERHAILMAGSFRSEEASDTLHRLAAAPNIHHIRLSPFTERSVGELITDIMALSEVPMVFARFLTRFSEGNPFFVSEYLRAAVSEGLLYRDPSGYWQISGDPDRPATEEDFEALPLPGALQQLVDRRIDGLSKPALDTVFAAAVIGEEIPMMLLWQIIQFDDTMLDATDELVNRQVLHEPEPGKLIFVHKTIRNRVYSRIPPAVRRRLHRTAAEKIELLEHGEPGPHLPALVVHWQAAGDPVKTRTSLWMHARHSARNFALKDAESSYRTLLGSDGLPEPDRLQALIGLASSVLDVQGRFEENLDLLASGLSQARALGDLRSETRVLLLMGKTNRVLGRMTEAVAAIEDSLAISRSEGDSEGENEALSAYASLRFNRGEFEAARELYEQSLALAVRRGDQRLEGQDLGNMAPILWKMGYHEEAIALFHRALDIQRELGDRRQESIVLGSMAHTYKFSGDMHRARQTYEQVIAIAREIGDLQTEAVILDSLATAYMYEKKFDQAEQLLERALQINRETQNIRSAGIAMTNLAVVYFEGGRVDLAIQYYTGALDIFEEVGDLQHQAVASAHLAKCYRLVHADWQAAERHLDAADTLFRKIRDQMGICMVMFQRGQLELAQNRSADRYLEQLQAVADRTPPGGTSYETRIFKKLQECQGLFRAGEPLIRGEVPEDVTPALLEAIDAYRSGEHPDTRADSVH